MYINNELRDLVYRNNLQHGFWDNVRTYEEFVINLVGEFKETKKELISGRAPTEVYFKKGNKPEGAPTELADIIIFILDYFGASEPQIDIDEEFLESHKEIFKNVEYCEQARKKEPWQVFEEIEETSKNNISISAVSHMLYKNEIYEDERGQKRGVPLELHSVMKSVLEFCDIYGIDMEKELINKINYNNSRPKDYRKIGKPELLETDPSKVFRETLKYGWRTCKETDKIVKEREQINNIVLGKRKARRELERGETNYVKKQGEDR